MACHSWQLQDLPQLAVLRADLEGFGGFEAFEAFEEFKGLKGDSECLVKLGTNRLHISYKGFKVITSESGISGVLLRDIN